MEGSGLAIAFGASVDEADSAQIGERVAEALRRAGLAPRWGGSA